MGYEIKLYLGSHSDIRFSDDPPEQYFSIVAWIDLSKPGTSNLTKIDKKCYQSVFFYGIDGNTKISFDPYGSSLHAIPAEIVLIALQKDWKNSKCNYKNDYGYRRFYMAIPLLERFIETFQNENPCVVIYGY